VEAFDEVPADRRYPLESTSRHLVDLVLGGVPAASNVSPGEIGARTVELLEAAYRSAAERRLVSIAELYAPAVPPQGRPPRPSPRLQQPHLPPRPPSRRPRQLHQPQPRPRPPPRRQPRSRRPPLQPLPRLPPRRQPPQPRSKTWPAIGPW